MDHKQRELGQVPILPPCVHPSQIQSSKPSSSQNQQYENGVYVGDKVTRRTYRDGKLLETLYLPRQMEICTANLKTTIP